MANVIRKATNTFSKGLVMDFSPENTKNEVLTHALNATLLTFNGNELSLQNDMGNARVETAYLPQGYIPVGTCEYGGIIYIVSYNPLEDKSLIGCFPSPERNISSKELGINDVEISKDDFLKSEGGELTGDLLHTTHKVILRENVLNPGDKFIVNSNSSFWEESLQDLYYKDEDLFKLVENPMLSLNIVSIEDSGKIVYLNNDVRDYTFTKTDALGNDKTFKYHIAGPKGKNDEKIDIDSYRTVLNSGYSVFKEKTSGKLAILAELVTIDSFAITHSIELDEENSDDDFYAFKVVLHPEVSPEVTAENYNTVPKLKHYYLKNAEGYLETSEGNKKCSFGNNFTSIYLFNTGTGPYVFDMLGDVDNSLKTLSMLDLDWSFNTKASYHHNVIETTDINNVEYAYFEHDKYYLMYGDQVKRTNSLIMLLYKVIQEGDKYILSEDAEFPNNCDVDALYGCRLPLIDAWLPFKPPFKEFNYLVGFSDYSETIVEGVSPMKLGRPSLLENNSENTQYKYSDVLFASFKLPKTLVDMGVNFPFKYDYTIVPCMEYGKLDYLAVSNTIDLNNLYNFKASKFTDWRYRIDGTQLTLTFGAEVFDTFETYKVDGLVLEFYDWRGFAGSLEITNKKSYSGTFTKIISLDALNTLSNKKILFKKEGETVTLFGDYITDYQHNVNILEEDGKYKLDNKEVVFNEVNGWRYATQENNDLSINDCGTMYSNLIYGVKPYLRIDVDGLKKFIQKDDLFLFTFPIFNENYYNTSNFTDLLPELNLILTYRLEDSSEVLPWNLTYNPVIKDGYTEADLKDKINAYKQGNYPEDSFDVIRYFQYRGTTKLNLEIGLMQDYLNFNLSCIPSINDKFSCNLKLLSENGESFQEIFENGENASLNHIGGIRNNHYFRFKGQPSDTNDTFPIDMGDFSQYNFITNSPLTSIEIEYSFIIGYSAEVSNIDVQTVPSNTVCALYHKQPTGFYNHEDFGIRKVRGNYNKEIVSLYLSDLIFYNTGSSVTLKFGLCKMVDLGDKDADVTDQCVSQYEYTRPVIAIDRAGKLIAGDPIKSVADLVGKLAFCLPFTPVLYLDSYTNVYASNIVGSLTYDWLMKHPSYLMAANTVSSLNNYSKFIVSKLNKPASDPPLYEGITARQLAKVNRTMLETLKSVYAYNPDYDLLPVRVGEVSVRDYLTKFISNILSGDAKISEDVVFNEYLQIGAVGINQYLLDLTEKSKLNDNIIITKNAKGKYITNINFKPNLMYCGEGDLYLVSQLTYNTPVPEKIYKDLLLDFSTLLVIRHEDGTHNIINGEVDKYALYGWLPKYNKLVLLDIENCFNDGYKVLIDEELYVPLTRTDNVVIEKLSDRWSDFWNNYPPTYSHLYADYNFSVPNSILKTSLFIQSLYYIKGGDYGTSSALLDKDDIIYANGKFVYIMVYAINEEPTNEFTNNLVQMSYNTNIYANGSPMGINNPNLIFYGNTDADKKILCVFLPYNPRLNNEESLSGSLYCLSDTVENEEIHKINKLELMEDFRDFFKDGVDGLYDLLITGNKKDFRGVDNIHRGKKIYEPFTEIGIDNELTLEATHHRDRTGDDALGINQAGVFVIRIPLHIGVSFDYTRNLIIPEHPDDVIPWERSTYDNITSNKGATIGDLLVNVNDLDYYPEPNGHRLFLRERLFKETSAPDGIYHRNVAVADMNTTLNVLRPFQGPCYNPNVTLTDCVEETAIIE